MSWTERYVRADAAGGGDGTTNTNSGANGAWTLAEAIAAYASGQRINVKAGTYANTSTDLTFGTAGTTTTPAWWRGFNTVIGDLDADFATAKPAITFTTGRFFVSAVHQIFSNLSISGAATAGPQVTVQANVSRFDRLRITNTGANALSRAFGSTGTSNAHLTRSYLSASSSATSVVNVAAANMQIRGCFITGGGHGIDLTSVQNLLVSKCVLSQNGADGIHFTSAGTLVAIEDCSFISPASDGIEFAAVNAAIIANVTNCLFSNCGVYGINNSTGTNTNMIQRLHNDFYNSGTANENGFGDSPSFSGQTESSSPLTSSPSDPSLVSTSNAKANGLPGLFENTSITSYMDIGAVQRQEPSGGYPASRVRTGM